MRAGGATASVLWDEPAGVRHPALPGDVEVDVDVAVVGAGLTGLWTA